MKKHQFLVLALSAMAAAPAFAQVSAVSEPIKLIDSEIALMAPVWSPDGTQIAVTGNNYRGIYVANADGSGLHMVTSDEGTGYKMFWSADSRTLTGFARQTSQNGHILRSERTYEAATGRAVAAAAPMRIAAQPGAATTGVYGTMTQNPATAAANIEALAQFSGKTIINPALSADGTKVAFQIPGKGMWLINNDGTGLRSLGTGSHPSWLPDNKTLVYTIVEDNGEIFTASALMSIDTTTGNTATIVARHGFIPMTPAVSPDGSKVAFENAADADIYIINIR